MRLTQYITGVVMKKIISLVVAVLLIAVLAVSLVACDDKDGGGNDADKLTIVYLGDSIAEALIGPSPVSERDNYGYYALVGRTNNMRYYNHSVSGHLTSGGMMDKDNGDGLLQIVDRDDETATQIKTHITQADVIHISVLGNNMLQFSLGSLMMEMADVEQEMTGSDRWFLSCFSGYENEAALRAKYADDKSLFDYLHDGGSEEVIRPSMWLDDYGNVTFGDEFDGKNVYTKDPTFNFPSTYQNIVDIVARLKQLNPTAKIVFQKVYNPVFEGTSLLQPAEYSALADRGYDTIEKVRALAQKLLNYLNGIVDEYNEKNPDMQVDVLDINKAFDDYANTDVDENGKVNLTADSRGRSLIYADWTHPSNIGHAIIAGATQKLLEQWGMADVNAVANYKVIKCDQIARMFASIDGFDTQGAYNAINGANTFDEVTAAYFAAINGYTPINY